MAACFAAAFVPLQSDWQPDQRCAWRDELTICTIVARLDLKGGLEQTRLVLHVCCLVGRSFSWHLPSRTRCQSATDVSGKGRGCARWCKMESIKRTHRTRAAENEIDMGRFKTLNDRVPRGEECSPGNKRNVTYRMCTSCTIYKRRSFISIVSVQPNCDAPRRSPHATTHARR